MGQQHVLRDHKADRTLGYITEGWQQGEGKDCPPLLCLHEAPSGELPPGLGPSAQERCVGVSPEEVTKGDQRAGAPVLWAEGDGLCSVWRDLTAALQYTRENDFIQGLTVREQGRMALN